VDDFDIAIVTEGEQLESIAADFSIEARRLGLIVTTETQPTGGIRAGLEWVMPTAVALFLANKYLGTLLQEAAKDHCPRLKAALLRLVRRTTGRTREVWVRVVTTSSAKVHDSEPATLSIWVGLRDARKAVFRFDHTLSPEALASAVQGLFDLLVAHERGDESRDFLSRASSFMPHSWAPVVMRFDTDENRWRSWVINRGDNVALSDEEAV
jgi:hypothetical protein